MLETVGAIHDNLLPLATAAKGGAEKLTHQVAACTKTPQTQEHIFVTVQQVMDQSVALAYEANSPTP